MAALRYECLNKPSVSLLKNLARLYRAAGWWEKGDTLPRLGRMVAGSHCFLVASEAGQLVGMARAISDRASDAYIEEVFVLPSHRRRGIAKAMLKRLMNRLKKDGLRWGFLIAAGESGPLYGAQGFRKMKRHEAMFWRKS